MKIEIDENRLPYRTTTNTPFMLDIRATAGDCIALPYNFLEMVQYNPSDALLLTFAACEVRIKGRNLASLYTPLVQHRIEYIQENDAKYEKVDDKKPYISRIEIKPLSKELELIVKGFNPEREPLGKSLEQSTDDRALGKIYSLVGHASSISSEQFLSPPDDLLRCKQ